MHTLLSNRHVWWFTLIYLGSIGVLIAGGRPLEDVIGAFLILGVLLPLVALAACTRMPKPQPPAPWRRDDGALGQRLGIRGQGRRLGVSGIFGDCIYRAFACG